MNKVIQRGREDPFRWVGQDVAIGLEGGQDDPDNGQEEKDRDEPEYGIVDCCACLVVLHSFIDLIAGVS